MANIEAKLREAKSNRNGPRDKVIKFRVTADEKRDLQEAADKEGMTVSDAVRRVLTLNEPAPQVVIHTDKGIEKIAREFNSVGVLLNQGLRRGIITYDEWEKMLGETTRIRKAAERYVDKLNDSGDAK